eukprot:CAMPEP_0184680610 /NCGR_PEP_ID=MMETSP0312-20130426/3503_1 /TAXON_ID=31354 /ORGANISM="Compsopogon coeruleus, Strain SAG 36.94" /LENGTH=234 /DNA_ID=CAMNT_0027130845 /DNA_START=281 /DNA_END=985 /DNA_ORIENTATION=+
MAYFGLQMTVWGAWALSVIVMTNAQSTCLCSQTMNVYPCVKLDHVENNGTLICTRGSCIYDYECDVNGSVACEVTSTASTALKATFPISSLDTFFECSRTAGLLVLPSASTPSPTPTPVPTPSPSPTPVVVPKLSSGRSSCSTTCISAGFQCWDGYVWTQQTCYDAGLSLVGSSATNIIPSKCNNPTNMGCIDKTTGGSEQFYICSDAVPTAGTLTCSESPAGGNIRIVCPCIS